MIDWKQIIGFDWDPGNERKSIEKHAVSRFEAEQVFFNYPLLVLTDPKHSQNEARCHALGKSDEARLLHITFTLRSDDTLIRVISARDMHRKERNIYEQS
ncbi:MAG: BrnT family toxin [Rhodothermales bacterium]